MPDIHAHRQPAAEFWLGVRHELPLQLGVIPFGLVFGILGLASGLTSLQTILLSSILFGGASQVVFAQLWAAGVPPLVVGGSVGVVNLRHVLYSASMAQYLRHLPLRMAHSSWLFIDRRGLCCIHQAVSRRARQSVSALPSSWQWRDLVGSVASLDNHWRYRWDNHS